MSGIVTSNVFRSSGVIAATAAGINFQSTVTTGTTLSVEAGKGYFIDTTSNICTVTLPGSASAGDQIVLVDYARTWGTYSVFINSNGLNFQGQDDTYTVEYSTSGATVNIVYSGATKGWTPISDDVVTDAPSPPTTQKAIMLFGSADNGATAVSTGNLISSSGVVASDTSTAATAILMTGAATYGFDKGIWAYGDNGSTGGNVNTNTRTLVSNAGVVASTVSGAGTARSGSSGAEYGTSGQAIIAFGYSTTGVNISNLVSNVGVVASDGTGVGTARYYTASGRYGVGLAIFGYGQNNAGNPVSLTNKVSSSGVVASDTTGVGTAGFARSFSEYGDGLGMFGFGNNSGYSNQTNRVSNTGVVASNGQAAGTGRMDGSGSSYGGNKGIFGFGYNGSALGVTNLVSSAGVVASDTSAVGAARAKGEMVGYSNSA